MTALPAATSPPVGRAWDRAGEAASMASMDTPIQPEGFLSPRPMKFFTKAAPEVQSEVLKHSSDRFSRSKYQRSWLTEREGA
jgi:hypothetical protein